MGEKGELSKILGAPFGLKLDVKEIDEFLLKKIRNFFKFGVHYIFLWLGR
jgi:hypothetical protein